MKKIGVIGLGNMGSAVARNIQRANFPLYVHDIRKDVGKKLIEKGAIWKNSPKELMDDVDIVVSMVFGPKEIEAVMKNENGILQSSCKDKGWIDLTTSSPSLMRNLAKEFEALGGFAVDAPVTGSLDAAIRGDMIMFVGGSEKAISNAKEVLEVIGEIRCVGDYGNGYVAKLVNNQLWKIHATAIGEAMVLAKKAGLEPELWWKVMKGGAADSFVLQHDVPSIFSGHYDPSFRLELALKDLDLIQDLIKEHGTRSELTQACHERFQEAANRYGDEAGEMTVCKLIEEDANINLRVKGNWIAPWDVKHSSEE
jgi:3-hydroxyisobutyrate dehydrogenase-like beta-hydroxyacid dehydrogenase|tara:strand:+ start:739 stop:1671 length:933 start_codon:yes stop_codon:yes gene_type:complete